MPRARRVVAALRREEGGLTLIELLVAATLGLVVVGGALGMFMSGVRSEPRTASKVAAIQQGRTTVERITRELRQGLEVPSSPAPSAQRLEIVTYIKAATCNGPAASTSTVCRVIYECSGSTCTRVVAQPDGSAPGAAVQVASGLASPNVFSYVYAPDSDTPSYVGLELAVVSSGAPVTLGDGVALRNSEAGGEEA